jgi:hypothetical protein
MAESTHKDPLEGCETREEYLQRFEEILQREIQISGYVAEYLKARCEGQSIEEAASLLPGPESPLARQLEKLCLVVDLLMRAREPVEADLPRHG